MTDSTYFVKSTPPRSFQHFADMLHTEDVHEED